MAITKMNGVAITSATSLLGAARAQACGVSIQSSYEFIEKFEGSQVDSRGVTGYDNTGWTSNSATNNPRYATSPAPLAGSYSYLAAVGFRNDHNFVTSGANAYAFFMLWTPTQVANDSIFTIRDSGGTNALANVQLRSGNTVRIQCANGSQASGTTALDPATTYYCWLEYTKGTGANAVVNFYLSTTSTKPGSPTLSITNGGSTTDAVSVRVSGGSATSVYIFDNIVLDGTKAIGSNPVP